MVLQEIPDAEISFEAETWDDAHCVDCRFGNNCRREEFGTHYPPYEVCVARLIETVRRGGDI